MNWHYRLVLMDVSSPDEPWYEMAEVYYDKGKITGWCSPMQMSGENRKSVKWTLKTMLHDLPRRALRESKLQDIGKKKKPKLVKS